MLVFPIAKINLGLNVVERRADGYHNLETVFYPIPLTDTLEITLQTASGQPSSHACDIEITNIPIQGDPQHNLVVRAYQRLAQRHALPPIYVRLHKNIPTQAGMGGGSSDAAYMIRLLNDTFALGMTAEEMTAEALSLGADCPFFLHSRPAYAEGVGEQLTPIDLDLSGWHIAIVKPDIPVPTGQAFSLITPRRPHRCCRDIVAQPVDTWRHTLVNDFEKSIFALHPQIGEIKTQLYAMGATYAAMSGSGSSVFALFREQPSLDNHFEGMFKTCLKL